MKRNILVCVFALLLVGFIAYPYATIWRIQSALQSGDDVALDALIDWPRVRESVKETIISKATEEALGKRAADNTDRSIASALGFALGAKVFEPLLDGLLSSRGMLAFIRRSGRPLSEIDAVHRISYAWFVSPTKFRIVLKSLNPDDPAVANVVMDFSNLQWRVSSARFDHPAADQPPRASEQHVTALNAGQSEAKKTDESEHADGPKNAQELLEVVRRTLREARVGYTGLKSLEDGIEVQVREGSNYAVGLEKLMRLDVAPQKLKATEQNGLIRLTFER